MISVLRNALQFCHSVPRSSIPFLSPESSLAFRHPCWRFMRYFEIGIRSRLMLFIRCSTTGQSKHSQRTHSVARMVAGKIADIPCHATPPGVLPRAWNSGFGWNRRSILRLSRGIQDIISFDDRADQNSFFDDRCSLSRHELCAVNPHAVEDHGELPGDRDHGVFHAGALRDA